MKFVALVSGGKDSLFAVWQCLQLGHELVAGVHLAAPAAPVGEEQQQEQEEEEEQREEESYMYQSAASEVVKLQIEECLGVPAIIHPRRGTSVRTGLVYCDDCDDDNQRQRRDEVEDLYQALRLAKQQFPAIEAVSCGAILSTYQRVRVEHCVCAQLQLVSLAYLWRLCSQRELLHRMLDLHCDNSDNDDNDNDNNHDYSDADAFQLDAVLVKTAAPPGLQPHRHLNRSLRALQPHLQNLHQKYQFHVCGEGGEYETLVLDCCLFKRRLVLDETEMQTDADDSDDDGVGVLVIRSCHTEAKENFYMKDSIGEEEDDDDTGGVAEKKKKVDDRSSTTIQQQQEENNTTLSETTSAAALKKPSSTTNTQRRGPKTIRTAVRSSNDNGIHFWPHVRRLPGGLWAVSELTSPRAIATTTQTTTGSSASQEAELDAVREEALDIFDTLQRVLAALDCTPRDVFFVHLYLWKMSHFAAINEHYRAFFGVLLPPSRSTVTAAAVGGSSSSTTRRVQLDCYVQCGSGAYLRHDPSSNTSTTRRIQNPYTRAALLNPHTPLRHVLHVQSRSHWAPVCVGPYSQVNTIRNALQFLAGQIGLVPATMALRGGGWTTQLEQCWTNAAAVLDAEGGGSLREHVLSCLLYASSRDVFFRDSDRVEDDFGNVVRRMWAICSEQIQRNGGIVPGAVDGTASSMDEPPAHGGYEDEETRRELEGVNVRSQQRQRRIPCPILVVAVPEMPVGALTEIEIVAATPKAASCLTISDSIVCRQGLVLPDAHPAAVVNTESLGWNTGYDFAPSPAPDHEQRSVEMDCFVRSLGTNAASFGFVTATLKPLSSETVFRRSNSRTDLDVRLVLSQMVRLFRYSTTLDMRNVLHLRLYYVAAEVADGTLLRSLFQTVLGLAFEESTMPASTVVPVDGMCVLDLDEPNNEHHSRAAPFLAIQAISIDPVHLEQSVWIHHGR